MSNPLVSIIIPVYNVEKFISECLNSILEQSYAEYEIIIVNDGSTDASQEVCEKFIKDDRIKLYNKSNGGLSSARNYGLDKAVGKYVIFIDSDDFWIDKNTLKHLVYVAENTNADVVRGEYKEVDSLGNELYVPIVPNELNELEHKQLNNHVFLHKVLSRGHFSWLFFIKKSIIDNYRFNEEQKFLEDIEFNLRFFSSPKVCVYTSLRFYAYRKRENSIMTTLDINKLKYSFQLSYFWYRNALKIEDEKLKQVYLYNSIMMYYWTLDTISQDLFFKERFELIEKLSLVNLRKHVYSWSKLSNNLYPLPIYISPLLGIYYLRFKHKIGEFLRKF